MDEYLSLCLCLSLFVCISHIMCLSDWDRVSCSPGWPSYSQCIWGWLWIPDFPASPSQVLGLKVGMTLCLCMLLHVSMSEPDKPPFLLCLTGGERPRFHVEDVFEQAIGFLAQPAINCSFVLRRLLSPPLGWPSPYSASSFVSLHLRYNKDAHTLFKLELVQQVLLSFSLLHSPYRSLWLIVPTSNG